MDTKKYEYLAEILDAVPDQETKNRIMSIGLEVLNKEGGESHPLYVVHMCSIGEQVEPMYHTRSKIGQKHTQYMLRLDKKLCQNRDYLHT